PEIIMVPSMELAKEIGNDRLGNMIVLGVLAEKTGVTSLESLTRAMKKNLPERTHKMIPANVRAMERGAEFARNGK
ncbi:MAG: 2-oxoacid:acceptor oxidoreductase family protein, partial [Thermodesulfobacteriota bacterium]|nr:2-oxoacid:acceptor oxidoreductase family protein [Thermodesulfobacteriota bacterium]